jgi:major membrane immunogen (membrane-anchored lipoprotein)
MKKVLLLAICFLLVLGGCSRKADVSVDQQSVLAYADPIADNLLEGFNEGNYTKFSRDFDEQMKNGLPEPVFNQTRQQIVSKVGLYKSRTVSKVQKQGPGTIVIYDAEFEKEKGVEVKVVFQKYGEKNLVSGLWFNSPKLRE